MRELKDGSWVIDSAFEAQSLGRAAAHGREDVQRLVWTHKPGHLEETTNEAEFFRREQEFGKLVISKDLAEKAEVGLLACTNVVHLMPVPEHNMPRLHPEAAKALLGALAMSRMSTEEAIHDQLAAIEAELEPARMVSIGEREVVSAA